jgi:nucleotide-binding universal stress UspA family protein
MKTLLVPTDFSAPAENAMLYAGHLAQTINASILLLHVYQIPVSMNEVPVLMMPAEELKQAAETGLVKAKELLQQSFPSVETITESRLGEVIESLNELCKEHHPVAVVAGKHGATGIERLLLGSTSLSIIRHSSVPVIIVPDTAVEHRLKNIAVAIDFLDHSIPQQKVKSFADEVQAQLHVVHVKTGKTEEEKNPLISELSSECTIIRDDEFVHGIETYIRENQIDMIIIIPHKHSLVERMFFKTHTKELMEKITIPVMCVPEVASV